METLEKPDWLRHAISASEDFGYGIEKDIEDVWADTTLTEQQKRSRINRMMTNARHEKWGNNYAKPNIKSNAGRTYR